MESKTREILWGHKILREETLYQNGILWPLDGKFTHTES
jgi:hypothetical protein